VAVPGKCTSAGQILAEADESPPEGFKRILSLVKVTFDTETDTYEQALAMLRMAYGKDRPNPGPTPPGPTTPGPATPGPASEDDQEPLTGIVIGNRKTGNHEPGNHEPSSHETGSPKTGSHKATDRRSGNQPAGAWTRGRLESFVRGLDQITAEAIRYIAAHAPAAPVTATLDHVSRYMFALRFISRFDQFTQHGMFASPLQGLLGDRPGVVIPDGPDSPVTRDDRNRTYRMDPATATIVIELLGPPAPDENRG
jgi:hypothetical protein